ncbi:MAG TPA: WD40 repeat domain-containing protein [Flavisolibacter sp.]|jgi:WD40 repeat protein|nr:WD40 repeat domain-containing protein [Flavisolibacter sp.]
MKRRTPGFKSKTILLSFLALLIALAIFALYNSILKKPTLKTRNLVQSVADFREHKAQLWAVQFHPQGDLIASGSVDNTVKIWRKDSGIIVHNLKQPMGVTTLCYSPDGGRLATGSYDAVVRVWNTKSGVIEKEFKGHGGTVWSVVFSSDGKMLASCGEDKTVKVWNAETGGLLKSITAHELNIWKVRFTPDASRLISSSFDQTIKVWNVADGSLLKTLSGHTQAVVGLAVSPDGKLLASGSDDATIKIWDMASGKLLRTLPNGDAHVYAVAFSPDGKRLISGSRDKDNLGEAFQNFIGDTDGNKGISMQLWDVQSGELLETFAGHANDVMDVCYSPDGVWIASASTDKTVQLWKTTNLQDGKK